MRLELKSGEAEGREIKGNLWFMRNGGCRPGGSGRGRRSKGRREAGRRCARAETPESGDERARRPPLWGKGVRFRSDGPVKTDVLRVAHSAPKQTQKDPDAWKEG